MFTAVHRGLCQLSRRLIQSTVFVKITRLVSLYMPSAEPWHVAEEGFRVSMRLSYFFQEQKLCNNSLFVSISYYSVNICYHYFQELENVKPNTLNPFNVIFSPHIRSERFQGNKLLVLPLMHYLKWPVLLPCSTPWQTTQQGNNI